MGLEDCKKSLWKLRSIVKLTTRSFDQRPKLKTTMSLRCGQIHQSWQKDAGHAGPKVCTQHAYSSVLLEQNTPGRHLQSNRTSQRSSAGNILLQRSHPQQPPLWFDRLTFLLLALYFRRCMTAGSLDTGSASFAVSKYSTRKQMKACAVSCTQQDGEGCCVFADTRTFSLKPSAQEI